MRRVLGGGARSTDESLLVNKPVMSLLPLKSNLRWLQGNTRYAISLLPWLLSLIWACLLEPELNLCLTELALNTYPLPGQTLCLALTCPSHSRCSPGSFQWSHVSLHSHLSGSHWLGWLLSYSCYRISCGLHSFVICLAPHPQVIRLALFLTREKKFVWPYSKWTSALQFSHHCKTDGPSSYRGLCWKLLSGPPLINLIPKQVL